MSSPHPLLLGVVLVVAMTGGPVVSDARAHVGSMAFWRVTVGDGEARSQILVPLADVDARTGHPTPSARPDGPFPDAPAGTRDERVRLLLAHLQIVEDGRPVVATEVTARPLAPGMLEVQARHVLSSGARERLLRSSFHELTDDGHRVAVRVDQRGRVSTRLLTASASTYVLSDAAPRGRGDALGPDGPTGMLRAFVWAGLGHIVTGWDHLLFLLCLLVPGGTWRSRTGIVTAFTVAHSLTLTLAALHVVAPPARFVETAIALSLAYVAIENLLHDGPRTRWPVAFGFGLVHGFGFATLLDVASLPARQWLPAVAAFNAGIELGQLAIVLVAVPLLAWMARQAWHRRLVQGTSVLVCGLAAWWVVERLS